MKLKFKAEKKDVVYFLMFCVLLLYIVAIAVLNLSEFTASSSFYGFNPIEAFSEEYISYTIPLFLFCILIVGLLVSSHFFEREKGIGIKTSDKKEDGYERWAKEKEIMAAMGIKKVHTPNSQYEAAGLPLIIKGDDMWVDDGETHTLIIGATGSGKTSCMVNPLVNILTKKGESMIITDPKGEIYEKNAGFLRDRGYNIILLNFRNPQKGNAWNPLTLPYKLYKEGNSDKANELLRDLAINILHEEKTDDPFWQNTAADFFSGLAQALFQDAKEDEINLNSMILMLTTGEERYGASTFIKEYFSTKEVSNPAYMNVAGTINAPNETKGSIISVFRQKVNVFAMAENLSEMLSYSDFNMTDIGNGKTAVFLIIQDEKKTYHALATIFVKQVYESLIDVAQENGGKLKIRTNFILDEFANLPPLKDITTMITAARSRLIRFNLIIQNFAQLNETYGEHQAETIKGNCGNTLYLLSSELKSLEEISKLAGERKIKKKDKEEVRPLISVPELQRLEFKDAILLKHRMPPFKTKLKFASEYNWNVPDYEKGKYIEREKRIVKYFDLKEYVKEAKKNKLFDVVDNPMSSFGNPFGPNPTPFNPFATNNDKSPLPNPFATNNSDDKYNVDDLIKKIDAKIAELEEEERQEKVKNNQTNVITQEETESTVEQSITMKDNIIESTEEPKIIDEPEVEEIKINSNIDEIIDSIKDEETTDDQFFDDFFYDEE
jgi:type IV secretion system protein VirD4